ncbi:TPA: hypothetical protein ACXJGM_003096 [Escherichia coli]|jgi:hypothetical protein|uniref:hypothetical protein n=1 Tax=Escherichia coli TaxID=562 RepID=UPI0005CD7739|nr:hypothetical protein [Escherichia coli]EGT0647615.1 hypothetical protein [Citrobacter braakii]DAM44315.1 MAG TPA: hypothetical protein [Caudoviricetes sp.]QMD88965.1 hypothetical protein HVZ27_05020 [Escherichia coli]QMH81151.1 hypothetical protein HVY24_05220 [Escherichia coli]STG42847.1 Uncharacterised protein [Escherichia coli]
MSNVKKIDAIVQNLFEFRDATGELTDKNIVLIQKIITNLPDYAGKDPYEFYSSFSEDINESLKAIANYHKAHAKYINALDKLAELRSEG